jgi:hypothetical protein
VSKLSKTEGYLKIKTKLDNSGIDKDISELENKINKLETKNAEYSQQQSALEKELNDYDNLKQKANEYKQKLTELKTEKEAMRKANPALAVTADTPEYANIKTQIGDMQMQYNKALIELEKQAPAVDKVATKLEKVKAKQADNNTKITQFKNKIDAIKADKITKQFNNAGTSIKKQIGALAKMSLAIVGIRTGIYMVRNLISTVSQYNPQIKADIDYIKYVLANSFVPLIKKIISFAATLLGYVNAVMSAWFGINLFSNSSAKNFQKMQKNASGTAKSLKEAQKSLAGFDEMNVLQDSNSSADSGVTAPSFDLSSIQGEVPSWLQWIIDNKDLVLGIIAGIGTALVAMKIVGLDPILSLGLGITIAGIVKSVKAIINFIQNPSWTNFVEVLEGISLAMVGIGVMVGVLTGNWIPLVMGLIALIVTEIVKHWDEIKNVLGAVGTWIYDYVIMPVWNVISAIIDNIVSGIKLTISIIDGIFTALISVLIAPFQTMWETVKSVFNGVKQMFQGLVKIIKSLFSGDIKGVLEGFKTFLGGFVNVIWSILKAPINYLIKGINALIRGVNKIKFDVPDWVPVIGGQRWGFNLPSIPELAKGGVISQPTQAIIGEAGKEAVLPLENNMEWLDLLANKLATKINSSGGGYYIINLDGRTIQRGQAKRRQELAFAMNGR